MIIFIISALGSGLSYILPKSLNNICRFIIAPGLGLILFTHLTLIFSFFFGLNFWSITLSLLLTGALAITSFLKLKTEFQSKNSTLFFAIVVTFVTIFLSFIWLTQTLFQSSQGLKTGGGGMYGDTALHAAYTSRLETGQFPIQNPLFAGKILVYPIANDLLSAILKINGLNFNLSFTLPQILFFAGFLTLFYKTARKFTNDVGFLISLLILFLGWGIGAFYFISEWTQSSIPLWQFLTKDYTNNSQYNLYFHNILTGLILPERSFLPGLFLGLLMFLYFYEYFKYKKLISLLINGIILGMLPLWHTHTFIFFTITSFIFALWSIYKSKNSIKDFGIMLVVSLLVAIPFLILFFSNHSIQSFINTSWGWQNNQENIILFWFKNSLLTIPLALAGFFLIDKGRRVFFISSFIVFVIANLVIFQPWDWDNIKLLSWSFLFFAILAGVFLSKIFYKGFWGKTFIVIIILISTASGILSVALQLKNKFVIYDTQDIDLANWAKTSTGINDVFIIETNPNHPIPGLAGRLVYIGYPGHLWVHGIDYAKRENQNNQILAGNFSQIDSLEVPISYVVLPKNKIYFDQQLNFQEVFQNQKYVVLKKTN